MNALSGTDALLACAAAESRAELHAARTALINSGGDVIKDLDRITLLAGDGTAGRHLLAGTGWGPQDSTALRSSRLQVRLLAQLARPTLVAGGGDHG